MIKSEENLRYLIQFIDFTSLNTLDTDSSLLKWLEVFNSKPNELLPAAICVYPNQLKGIESAIPNNVKKAVVGGVFPHNQTFNEIRKKELEIINTLNLEEVDVVILTREVIEGDWKAVEEDLKMVRKATEGKALKIILETSVLNSAKLINKSAELAIETGADFLKTSTGKEGAVADEESVKLLCKKIKDHHLKTGKKVGVKVSGGVRSFEDAVVYHNIVKETLGNDWLTPNLFRIGASSLYTNLLDELKA